MDYNGTTPLHAACKQGRFDCVAQLLQAGADVDEEDPDGQTPLRIARACDHEPCVKLLLNAKLDDFAVSAEEEAMLLMLAAAEAEENEGLILGMEDAEYYWPQREDGGSV